MAHRTTDVTQSIEKIDLTDDSYLEALKNLNIPENVEEKEPPLIYDLDEDESEHAESNDSIRLIYPKEQSRIEHREASESSSSRRNYLTQIEHLGFIITLNSDVELDSQEFFRAKKIYRDRNSKVQMKGILLVRTRSVHNMLPKKCNEVCALVTASVDRGSKLPDVDEYLTTRPLSSVVCKRKIIFTNQLFPVHSFRVQSIGYKTWQAVEEHADLICRYKYVEFLDTVKWKVPSQALARLRKHECDIGITDAQLMLAWRKMSDKHPVTPQEPASRKRKVVDLTADGIAIAQSQTTSQHHQTAKRVKVIGGHERQSIGTVTGHFTPRHVPLPKHPRVPMHTPQAIVAPKVYTCGDICAGAGGATTAARRAGLAIQFALDFAVDPCATLRLNFPGTKVLNMDIYDFCDANFKLKTYMRVDVLHISFPCQVYSVAHSHTGKDDERNEAAGYSVIPLLTKVRPRVVTFEQSPNITKQHRASFDALIHQIVDMGYSVRWKIVNFADYGNCQSRNRLFMIASCPGEPLPPFPEHTHGDGPGLLPYVTINDNLKEVPKNIAPHMAETVIWRSQRDCAPYNGDRPLRGAITCGGGEANLHPSGERPFNNQELSQLQGFPKEHEFFGTKSSIMRRIGNAVPGKAATPFFKEIVESLKRFDQEVEKSKEVINIE